MGEALLAQLDANELEAILGSPTYPRCTPAAVTEGAALLAELEVCGRSGFAISREENIVGAAKPFGSR
jgi:DNA-binding IclR family transcriptional regulator